MSIKMKNISLSHTRTLSIHKIRTCISTSTSSGSLSSHSVCGMKPVV